MVPLAAFLLVPPAVVSPLSLPAVSFALGFLLLRSRAFFFIPGRLPFVEEVGLHVADRLFRIFGVVPDLEACALVFGTIRLSIHSFGHPLVRARLIWQHVNVFVCPVLYWRATGVEL